MNCPLCNSSRHSLFRTWPTFRVVVCSRCGFMHTDARRARAGDGAAAGNDAASAWAIDPGQPHIRRRVRDIMRFASPGRALDIGCGRGEVSILLSQFGFCCEGIDVARDVIDRLQSAAPEVVWHCGRLEAALGSLGPFDVVTMYHVLEHVPRPLEVMGLVKRIVKRGGLVVIEVPNAGGLHARLKGRAWPYFEPGHVSYFRPPHLSRMAEALGWDILAVKGFYHFSHPQEVWWKDAIKGALARVGFKDVIAAFMRAN